MLEVETSSTALRRAQRRFTGSFEAGSDWSGDVTIGYRGGAIPAKACWHSELGVWGSFNDALIGEHSPRRFWNAFGVQDPTVHGSNLSITVEINPPYAGINRRMSGVYARDLDTQDIFVLQRGRIGGGKPGIGASTFWNVWDEELTVEVSDGDRNAKLALVAHLGHANLPAQVAWFVRQVRRIKDGEALVPPPKPDRVVTFNPEFVGSKQFAVSGMVAQRVNHGVVVNALHKELAGRGLWVGNTPAIDLYLQENGNVTTVFEIKTSTAKTLIYGAIGQLMLNGRVPYSSSRLVLVVPNDERAQALRNDLTTLGVAVLLLELDVESAHLRRPPRTLPAPSR